MLDVQEILASTTQKFSPNAEKKKTNVMLGRSQYGFPSIKALKKHRDRSAKKDLEAHLDRQFKSNQTKRALVMVDQEK